MRSYRYNYKHHCATDCLHSHIAGWHTHHIYPMQSVDDHQWRGDSFYKMKNYEWWIAIHRWDWRFTNKTDERDFVFSNMEYTKWRKGHQYYTME